MVNEKRLIDANAYPCQNCDISYCYKNCAKFNAWFNKTMDAVEVVHGRWMNVQNGKGICSNCNRLDSIDNLAIYCRYCGAKMDGGKDK